MVKELDMYNDERGTLMEILRSDWDIFDEFGQTYFTTAYPEVVKAWHMHKEQTDHMACIHGMVKMVLYDGRKDSETQGEVMELFVGECDPKLVKIPPRVYHGFKTIGEKEAIVVNVPNRAYDYESPDEYRKDPDTDDIPYDWVLKDGMVHG